MGDMMEQFRKQMGIPDSDDDEPDMHGVPRMSREDVMQMASKLKSVLGGSNPDGRDYTIPALNQEALLKKVGLALTSPRPFKKGDVVVCIDKSCTGQRIPLTECPAVVLDCGPQLQEKVIENWFRSSEGLGQPWRPYDTLLACIVPDGDLLQFLVDSRFFRKIGVVQWEEGEASATLIRE